MRTRAAARAANTQAVPRTVSTVSTVAAAALGLAKVMLLQRPKELLEATKLVTEVVQGVAMPEHDLNEP
ncbi:hypothetical protein P3T76_008761 [Phytophthora citrophthora]|uniref:Uncharacterized protein n=1 Tax=Phytophthora citrophthora TaxID=4793 RepID=A0AAD9GJ32_9STRA|nr:hypothetical protein P3T76_008761 [Phytophthora citrophthora]